MKNVIVSDIHGNVDALLALIKKIHEEENTIDRFIIAGDIVGYGASPNECCDIVRYLIYGKRKVPLENLHKILEQPYFEPSETDEIFLATKLLEKKGVAIGGNHDKESAGIPSFTSEMNPVAKTAAEWTKGVLTKENLRFLKKLSLRKVFDKRHFEIVHGSPAYPQGWEYVKNACILKYETLKSNVTFGGHTHRPAAYIYTKETRTVNATILIPADNYDMRLMLIEKNSTDKTESFTIETTNDWKYYINVGSLGQPRDGNPHGSYVVFDTSTNHIIFKRVPYNTEAASNKIKTAKLPNELAQRVLKGN